MLIVVTGGAGFIGSHLCALLSEEGHKVRIIDIAPPPLGTPGELVRASVLDAPRLSRLFSGADAVVHLAALIDVGASVENPYADFSVNALGTLNVLEAAREAGVGKVAYASSAAVYGNPVSLPIDEEHRAVPLSPYGASKLCAERYVLLYNSLYGMANTALRLFNVYGKGQSALSPYSGVITKFVNAALEKKRPRIYGDGGQTRDFVHVDDVCQAFLRAIDSQGSSQAMNVASGEETAVLELWEILQREAGIEIAPEYLPERKGEIKRSVADISLAKKQLGFKPSMSLSHGLRELLEG